MGRLRITRRVSESVVVTVAGVRFTVSLADLDHGKAGLVFDAPGEVQINRAEVQARLDAIAAERLTDSKPQ